MGGVLILQLAFFGHVIIRSPAIKIAIFSLVIFYLWWGLLSRPCIFLNASIVVLLCYVSYVLLSSIVNPDYNLQNFGYFSCLILMLCFSLFRSGAIVLTNKNTSSRLDVFVVILSFIISTISIVEQIDNQPFLSGFLGISPNSGIHYIGDVEPVNVFYGWHDEVIPIISISLGTYFRSVSIFPNGLDFGLVAIFLFCFYVNKLKTSSTNARSIYLIGLVFSIVLIFGVHTRVIWVAFFVVVYFYAVLALKIRVMYTHILLFFGIIGQFGFTVFATIYSMYATSGDNVNSVLERVDSWLTAFELITKSPSTFLFGTGIVETPINGLLIDNTFISLFLYGGLMGVMLIFLYITISYVNIVNIFITFLRQSKTQSLYVCPIVLTGAPIFYALPILWSFNNYQQRLIIFFVFPILMISAGKNILRLEANN